MTILKSDFFKPVVVLDLYSLVYRYGFGLKDLVSPDGKETGAIYGLLSLLDEISNIFEINSIVVCRDTKCSSKERKKLFVDYKCNRPLTPEFISIQIEYLWNLFLQCNVECLSSELYEADDLIGTISSVSAARGYKTLIITCDKDMLQLVIDNIVLVYLIGKNKRVFSSIDVQAKFGVLPHHIPDFLALAGDSSDSIPGVPGIGPVTAAKLLLEFNDIYGIFSNLSKIDSKIAEKLMNSKEMLPIYRNLTTIRQIPELINSEVLLHHKKLNLSHLAAITNSLMTLGINERLITRFVNVLYKLE